MKWSFLLPGVLVALHGLWHAAPSRDETVLLASSQRPADCSHVSACLSVNNCRSLPSSSLLFFPLSHSFLCHLLAVSHMSHSYWQFRPFLLHFANTGFLSSMNMFFIFFSWLTSAFSAFCFSLPQRPCSQDDCEWWETLHYQCLMNERQQMLTNHSSYHHQRSTQTTIQPAVRSRNQTWSHPPYITHPTELTALNIFCRQTKIIILL